MVARYWSDVGHPKKNENHFEFFIFFLRGRRRGESSTAASRMSDYHGLIRLRIVGASHKGPLASSQLSPLTLYLHPWFSFSFFFFFFFSFSFTECLFVIIRGPPGGSLDATSLNSSTPAHQTKKITKLFKKCRSFTS